MVGGDVGLSNEGLPDVQTGSFIDNPTWFTTRDAAIYLRKFRKADGQPSEGAIRTAIWRGDLKAKVWRRRLYIRKSQLDKLLQEAPFAKGGTGWA